MVLVSQITAILATHSSVIPFWTICIWGEFASDPNQFASDPNQFAEHYKSLVEC